MKKQVFIKVPKEFIPVDKVDVEKFYGTETNDQRGFIFRHSYGHDGKFTIKSPDSFTKGNGWDSFDSDDFLIFIEKVLEAGFSIYEFDTFKELMEWVVSE